MPRDRRKLCGYTVGIIAATAQDVILDIRRAKRYRELGSPKNEKRLADFALDEMSKLEFAAKMLPSVVCKADPKETRYYVTSLIELARDDLKDGNYDKAIKWLETITTTLYTPLRRK